MAGDSDGLMQIATGGPSGSVITLRYDGVGEDTAPVTDLTDGGENDHFLVRFLFVDGGLNQNHLKMAIAVSDGAVSSRTISVDVPNSLESFDLAIPYADFEVSGPDPNPFANARSVTVVFNQTGVTDVDFQVDFIAAVPEPATWMMLLAGAGGLALVQWRRMRRPHGQT
jgi:hypothetical protein